LRTGEVMSLSPEGMMIGARRHDLATLRAAALITAPTPTPAPGAAPAPAIWLQLQDGSDLTLIPTQPYDAWRMLEAIYVLRPDLRRPLPPAPTSWGASASSWAMQPDNQHLLAGISHLSIFFLPFILPLVLSPGWS
jgi:hypothetical protein